MDAYTQPADISQEHSGSVYGEVTNHERLLLVRRQNTLQKIASRWKQTKNRGRSERESQGYSWSRRSTATTRCSLASDEVPAHTSGHLLFPDDPTDDESTNDSTYLFSDMGSRLRARRQSYFPSTRYRNLVTQTRPPRDQASSSELSILSVKGFISIKYRSRDDHHQRIESHS